MEQLCLRLEGLDCANCASKIEKRVSRLETVRDVNLNFIKKEISLKYVNIEKEKIIGLIAGITNELEPDVIIMEKNTEYERDYKYSPAISKRDIAKFSAGIFLYILGLAGGLEGMPRFAIFAGAYMLFGADVLLTAARNIVKGRVFDENFLMSISTIGAFAIGEYPEGVAVMLFYQIGETLQGLAVNKSRDSIKALMNIKPEFANILKGCEVERVNPENVHAGDIIIVRAGEKIPLDGIIMEGSSQIDASSLIGESVPRVVREGDEVLNGAVNITGLIKIRVTKEYSESTVAKILDMVENASAKKAPAEKFITKFSAVYTPVVVLMAAALAFIPPIFVGDLSAWVYRGLVFLVVSCPCALVVSVPLSFFGGIGAASKRGILMKGGNFIQELSRINTVVFDKTGTLTKGVFEVEYIEPGADFTAQEVMRAAYAVERFSNHPIAQSISNAYNEGFEIAVNDFEEISGKGLRAKIGEENIAVGSARLMNEIGVEYKEYTGIGTAVYVSCDKKFMGFIVISDKIKEDGKEAVALLKKLGIGTTIMLTGDRRETARKVAEALEIDRVEAELLPHEKVIRLEELYEEQPERRIIFTGDGINDAPVLARAEVGIAMGGVGSDAAIEAADVIIMTDEPKKIAEAITIARNTMNIVKQNIIISLAIKIVVLGLGTFGYANMWMAVFADVGVTLLVVLNAARIRYIKE